MLATRYGQNTFCVVRAKAAECATDIEVMMREIILAVSRNYRINRVLERLIMDRTRYAS